MENFRKPNFELVADILYWMVKLYDPLLPLSAHHSPPPISCRYDPETTISDRVEFENERVDFLTDIASLLASKARLKLNTKKLYASDGRAVQELLKLATLLFRWVRLSLFLSGLLSSFSSPVPQKKQNKKLLTMPLRHQ
jgi:clusterin-associated protein 1